jgi:hypothetical protein
MVPININSLLQRKADINATGDNMNFPAARTNTFRRVSGAGYLGGGVGVGLAVGVGDLLFCVKTTPAGTYAEVGDNWNHYSHIIAQGPPGIQGPPGSTAIDGVINAVGNNTNFPASNVSKWYKVIGAGWLGGPIGEGEYVDVGDMLFCNNTTVAGTKAEVGLNWNLWRSISTELATLDSNGEVVLRS